MKALKILGILLVASIIVPVIAPLVIAFPVAFVLNLFSHGAGVGVIAVTLLVIGFYVAFMKLKEEGIL